jgi:hypothetical protein
MTKIDIISKTVSEWTFKMAQSVLPQVRIPVGGKIGGFMQILGVDPSSYNIWGELGFLAEPMIQTLVTPMVGRLLANIPEEQVSELTIKYIDAFITQAKEKGAVNVFGVQLEEADFADLKSMLQSRMKED